MSEREDAIDRAAGFTGPQRVEVASWVDRTGGGLAASVYSPSSDAP
jgi:hypothetical protein